MLSRRTLLLFLCLFASLLPLQAQLDIGWISDSDENAAGFVDEGFVLFLEFEGHTVSRFDFGKDGSSALLTDAEIEILEGFDLVIISPNTNPARYADAIGWNQLLVPMIVMNPELLIQDNWGWENVFGSVGLLTSTALVEDILQGDPIFLNAKESVNDVFALVDSSTPLLNIGASTGRQRVLSRDGSGNVWVSQWEAGLPFFEGSLDVPGGKRMFFAAGQADSGAFNLTLDGEEVLRNAIRIMTSQGEVLWVSDDNRNAENEFIDAEFVDQLEGLGYFVWRDNFAENTTRMIDFNDSRDLNAEEVSLLESNELIIFSRNTLSRTYNDVAGWNNITTPILVMNPYLLRPERWGWVSQNALVRIADPLGLRINGDPLLSNVSFNEDNVLDLYTAGPVATDGDIPGRITFRMPANEVGTPRVISRGRQDDQQYTVLATWEADQPFFAGSELSPKGDRVYFSAGVDAKAGTSIVGAYNLTANGLQVLENVIDSILGYNEILWISEGNSESSDTDRSIIELLRANGYTVYLDTELPSRTTGASLADDGPLFFPRQRIAELVDLIIFSRDTDPSKYTDAAGWNEINTPMMVLNPNVITSANFNWVATAAVSDTTNDFAPLDFDDPVLAGIASSPATFALTDTTTTILDIAGAGNGEAIGFDTASDLWIARWAPDTIFYSGGGVNTGGWKTFFAAGDATTAGTLGSNNLTAEGQLIFLNAVEDLIARSQEEAE